MYKVERPDFMDKEVWIPAQNHGLRDKVFITEQDAQWAIDNHSSPICGYRIVEVPEPKKYMVERNWGNKWEPAMNVGLFRKLFDTKIAAEEAKINHGSPGCKYRIVEVPERKYTVQLKSIDGTWGNSSNCGWGTFYLSQAEAIAAINERGSPGLEYRVVVDGSPCASMYAKRPVVEPIQPEPAANGHFVIEFKRGGEWHRSEALRTRGEFESLTAALDALQGSSMSFPYRIIRAGLEVVLERFNDSAGAF